MPLKGWITLSPDTLSRKTTMTTGMTAFIIIGIVMTISTMQTSTSAIVYPDVTVPVGTIPASVSIAPPVSRTSKGTSSAGR